MILTIRTLTLRGFAPLLAVLLSLLTTGEAQGVNRAVFLGAAADVNAISVLPDGTAVVVGGDSLTGFARMWTISTSSAITPATLTGPGGAMRLGVANAISADGSRIAGSIMKSGSLFQFDGAVWNRTQPTAPTIVPDLDDFFPSTQLLDVSSTGVAVGASSIQSAYRWSSASGGTALPMTNASNAWASGVSANGTLIVGSAIDNTQGHPVATVWNNGVYSVLDYEYSAAYGASPNGQYIVGASDLVNDNELTLDIVYWKNGQRQPLYTSTGQAVDGQALWATDAGIIGGFTGPTGGSPVEGWIYIEGMNAPIAFNEWWKQLTGTTFPIDVTSIPGAVERNGELYLAIEGGYMAQVRWAAPADANRDRTVDGADYTIWADNFLKPLANTFELGDFNGDRTVDAADYTLWADNFRPASAAQVPFTAAPEPSSLALAAVAGLWGLWRARVKRSRV